jgi:hypothetical protein
MLAASNTSRITLSNSSFKTASKKLDKIAETPQIGIRASPNMWRKPITSVPADDEANLKAGRPTVKKNISVPDTTAVLRMPTRDTGHIQWFIVPRESGIVLSII